MNGGGPHLKIFINFSKMRLTRGVHRAHHLPKYITRSNETLSSPKKQTREHCNVSHFTSKFIALFCIAAEGKSNKLFVELTSDLDQHGSATM